MGRHSFLLDRQKKIKVVDECVYLASTITNQCPIHIANISRIVEMVRSAILKMAKVHVRVIHDCVGEGRVDTVFA